MIDLEHSPLGGSGAKRWITCGGSFLLHRELLENGELEEIPSSFAEIGTAAHEVGARCLSQERDPFEYHGETFNGFVAGTDFSLDAVAAYVNICERIWPRDGKGTALIERTLHHPESHPLLKGTVDFAYWSDSRGLWIRDYKNGEGVGVDAPENAQLLYYAFLVILDHPSLRESAPDEFPVSLGIVQPNFRGMFDPEGVWLTTLGYVKRWGTEVLLPRMHALTAQRDMSDDDFVPGDHCQFCPVLLECPKAQAAFNTFVNGEEFPAVLTNDEIDTYYAQKDLARKFMTELDKVAYARAVSGTKFTNAKLVEKKSSRQWSPEAIPALVQTFGEAAYKPLEVKSPAEVEKMSTRAKDFVKEWARKPIAEGLSLTTMSDPRPAATPKGNAEVFKGFEQSPEQMGF